jgi:hypothetical protein
MVLWLMDISGRYEELIALLGSQLPSPVEQEPGDDGSIVFTGGAPPEVVVHLTDSSVRVSEFAFAWETPHTFVVKPRLVGVVKWRRLSETAVINAVSTLIKGAREVRLARYRPCSSCGEKFPPEQLFDGLCERCAEQPHDVVH